MYGSFSKEKQNLQGIYNSILKKSPGLSNDDERELNKVQILEKLINNIEKVKVAGVYKTKIKQLESLKENLESFEIEKARGLLKNLSRDIEKYYIKLNPDEPIMFSEIVQKGKSRNAKMKGVSYGKEINPVTCFSESHMNSLGFSIYFPQRVDHNQDWGFILLDDPIQSLDQAHSIRLIDLLKEKSQQKQIIVLSHQKTFCDDFDDKFYYDKYLMWEFSKYDVTGPQIELKKGSLENCLEMAKKNANGNTKQRENAATELRKAIEVLCSDMLIQKFSHTSSQVRKLVAKGSGVSKLYEKLEKITQVDNQDIAELRVIENIGNPSAHGILTRDVTPSEIKRGIIKIEEIRNKYL